LHGKEGRLLGWNISRWIFALSTGKKGDRCLFSNIGFDTTSKICIRKKVPVPFFEACPQLASKGFAAGKSEIFERLLDGY
jgi:hypothetical protein